MLKIIGYATCIVLMLLSCVLIQSSVIKKINKPQTLNIHTNHNDRNTLPVIAVSSVAI